MSQDDDDLLRDAETWVQADALTAVAERSAADCDGLCVLWARVRVGREVCAACVARHVDDGMKSTAR